MPQALDRYVADRIGEHRARTAEGYLLALGVPIARTGWQTYRAEEVDKDGRLGLTGMVDMYRAPEEVFSPAAIASFEGKSITSPHPPQFLNPANEAQHARGHVQNVRRGKQLPDGEFALLADLMIKHSDLIMQVESGSKVDISCGYDYAVEPYDEHSPDKRYRMTNIRGNHVAIVQSGRAGSHVRVLDANPEEGANSMAEPAVSGKPEGELSGFLATWKNLREVFHVFQAADGESEAVERNRRVASESNKLRLRVKDADDPEMDEEDKGADKPDKKDEKGSGSVPEELKEEKKAMDTATSRLNRVCDALEIRLRDLEANDATCTCDAEGDEDHKEECEINKHKSEDDGNLIPVETLEKDERPTNPIPGMDQASALAYLNSIKPAVAKSGDRRAIDSWNGMYRKVKGLPARASDNYSKLANRTGDKVRQNVDDLARRTGTDARTGGADPAATAGAAFAEAAARYLGKNVAEVPTLVVDNTGKGKE